MVLCDTGCLHYQGPWTLCPLNLCTEQPSLQPFASGVQPCPMSSPSVQFSSVAQSCPTLCDPIDCSQASLSVTNSRSLLKLISLKSVMPSILSHLLLLPLSIFPASGYFPMSQFVASGGQSIGVSASTSVLPMNIQDLFPLGLTGWISLQSKGLSRVFSKTIVQKHQFFSAQLSL